MIELYLRYGLGFLALVYLLNKAWLRIQLSRAKHPSLRGHSKWSRRIASVIKSFSYDHQVFFQTDGAPNEIAVLRKQALQALGITLQQQSPNTFEHALSLEQDISDVQFVSQYRVPFPYSLFLPKVFKLGAIIEESKGVQVKDLDGNWRYDLSGSYGVNVFGYDFYKDCLEKGADKVAALGPALGSYHPLIAENVSAIKSISGLDEVSFHMSGTEAVMQAVRLARYHTKKTHLVRFCGAYHGWWDGVQPGVGNRRKTHDVYTLADLSEKTLKVLASRNDIACLLINPMQAFHPNSDSFSDSTLIASDRSTHFDKAAYSAWLNRLRRVCTAKGIVLIFDEIFTGFRLGYRGAQEYFGIQADMVTYGKTLGGGLPVGVLAGRADLMKRFKKEQPINVSFARGTFNSHPYVMGTMHEFLTRIQQNDIQAIYQTIEQVWQRRISTFNQRLVDEKLPLKINHMHTVFTVIFQQPSRYNWMLQFYLRAQGLELSWLGSGRMIMSFNFTDDEFNEVIELFIGAALKMQADAWWWQSPLLTNKAIKRQFLKDMLTASWPWLGSLMPNTLSIEKNTVIEQASIIDNKQV